ncbi:host attachment protein [Hydrogenimonas thermophila]|uniref:Protein required for attachment to host cells n=1 Tax=Hydrogenimonas thermophila TaxID=223786 RepID=A0A1I5M5E1_9BACT|nr:host attachment protein [Hydrogenimonas thermophila]WOE70549.1 host attachment protein [Hydrogenimonas thermophila]WOE73065.1 host attachment protein [Hydrogenimonas thermophila]SFP04537.1 Protein required for attachment to host cells [Hydrogenimonas thermophila]
MRVGDIVIVSDLGEMKIYRAAPRDLEAEADSKSENIKLDLIETKDYLLSHWKVHDLVSDQAGRFKGGNQGENHELIKNIEEDIIKTVAKDISKTVSQGKVQKWFLGASETVYDQILEKVSKSAKETLFLGVKKDLVKTDKIDLIKIFKKKI